MVDNHTVETGTQHSLMIWEVNCVVDSHTVETPKTVN